MTETPIDNFNEDLPESSDGDSWEWWQWLLAAGGGAVGLYLAFFVLVPLLFGLVGTLVQIGLIGLVLYGIYRMGKGFLMESDAQKTDKFPGESEFKQIEKESEVSNIEHNLDEELSDDKLRREIEELERRQ